MFKNIGLMLLNLQINFQCFINVLNVECTKIMSNSPQSMQQAEQMILRHYYVLVKIRFVIEKNFLCVEN